MDISLDISRSDRPSIIAYSSTLKFGRTPPVSGEAPACRRHARKGKNESPFSQRGIEEGKRLFVEI
jgi:hypothetical protein